MLFKPITVLLALSASFVAVVPCPTSAEVASSQTEDLTTHTGKGTIYTQQGGIGSCGHQNTDSVLIAALSNHWQNSKSPGPYCGRLVKVTNIGSNDGVGGKGNTVIARVEDTCPECDENHIDFSVGAWNQLTNTAPWGTVEIEWHFCDADGTC